eukprot:gene11690-12903_t
MTLSQMLQDTGIPEAIRHIMYLGPSALLSKFDVKQAFHLLPVQEEGRRFLGLRWQQSLYFDLALPFGLRSAPKMFSRFTDVLQSILLLKGSLHYIQHYLDELLITSPVTASLANEHLGCYLTICNELGVPIAPGKTVGPATTLTYLNFELDTVLLELRIPPAKIAALRKKLEPWLSGDSMTKKIRRKEINDEARDYHVLVKSFPGATVEKMKYYLEPEIMSNPEGVIIHCGTNNLRNESPESVANKIVELAMEAKKRTQHVAVSSLVMRTDSNELDLKRARDSIDSNPISVKSPLGLENRQVPLESRGSPLFESVQEFSTNVSLESGVCNDIENNLNSTELLGQHSGEFSTSDTFPSPSLTASSQSDISDFPDDLQNLFGLRAQYHNHPIIGFLNINSIRYKITDLRIIIEKFLPDILVIQETKLSSEFNNNAFLINNYKTPMRQDRDEFGGD